ncbi:hypothetical protein J4E91_009049 [Alternaria rosae]|nr:hypothetical protein J4E91_009049 [Alternaria rosae]
MTLSTAQTPTDGKGSWLPFTFRWYSLLIPISATAILGITISLLIWYSQNHYGLGTDDGSSAALFGWRFTPTLLAVLYTQSTVILFEDAKRTEPFARLAQAPSEGASAFGTVLQTPRAWYAIFLDIVLKRKSVGKTSWCLICTAVINVVALLAISPLSSALLTSEEIVITKTLDIHRSVPKIGLQLPIVASREAYFRTTSALMRNISTSAWIKDTSITFPNWPSTDTVQLGPDLISSFNSWTAETRTIDADFACRDMTLESADLAPMEYKAYDVMDHGPYKGIEPMVAFVLASDDGCRYEATVHPAAELAMRGGLTWSNTSTFYIEPGTLPLGRIPFAANVSSTSPYARHYASPECADRDIIILNTPWTKPVKLELSAAAGVGIEFNRTYQRSPDFRMKALLCKSQYSVKTHNITTSIGQGKEPNITFMESEHIQPESITKAMLDIPKFQEMALQDTWKDYFNAKSMSTDADRAMGGSLSPYSDPNTTTNAPMFFGLGPLLGALYEFNVTEMLYDKKLASRAARVKGRFFAECLREALNDPDVTSVEVTKGKATVVENRIMVLREIGIALATLFLVSFLLLILLLWVSQLSFRPLDLSMDPGSTLGHAIGNLASTSPTSNEPPSYWQPLVIRLLTVSMSALFERQAANVSRRSILERTLEPREIPIMTTVKTYERRMAAPLPGLPPFEVLNDLLMNPSKNWLPGAAIQLSLNGTKPSWTQDDWSFIPLDLTSISQLDAKETAVFPNNVTITTSALRARLECEQVPEVANTSTWLIHTDEIQLDQYSPPPRDLEGLERYYTFNSTIFGGSPSNTSAFATTAMLSCCSNGTKDDPDSAVAGYWSPVDVQDFPNADRQWPVPFVTKWIVGKPITVPGIDKDQGQMLLFKDVPDLQAARCMPIVETSDAKVVVDVETGKIQSHEIISSVGPAKSAWSEVFVRRALTHDNATQQYDERYEGPLNITTSYGILFMGSMFKAADSYVGPRGTLSTESISDNAFVMRDPETGINMDLMTYSMYSLANKNPRALLDYATLVTHANHTFQTFFQHFISNGLSLEQGGWGYQKIGDNSTQALGEPVTRDGRVLPRRKYASLRTNRTVEASVSHRTQVLHMNAIATYLSVAIIIWLIGTTAVVSFLQRKYTGPLIRDVQLIADVLVLVAGSDHLLRLVEGRGVALKNASDVKTMLAWFKDRDGEVRWGIEVVGGSDAAEWVDAPKTGWHAQGDATKMGMEPWVKKR